VSQGLSEAKLARSIRGGLGISYRVEAREPALDEHGHHQEALRAHLQERGSQPFGPDGAFEVRYLQTLAPKTTGLELLPSGPVAGHDLLAGKKVTRRVDRPDLPLMAIEHDFEGIGLFIVPPDRAAF